MQYNEDDQLDTSQVQDTRGGGMLGGTGGKLAVGGGGLGIIGVIIAVVVSLAGGGGSSSALTNVLGNLGQGGPANRRQLQSRLGMQDRGGCEHQAGLRRRR